MKRKKKMKQFSQEQIQKVNQIDLRAVLQDFGIKQLDSRRFENPFRIDDTPSFSVFWSEEKGIWLANDLGRSRTWRVLEFVREFKRMSFVEAMYFLLEFEGTYTKTDSFFFSKPSILPLPNHREATPQQINALNHYLKFDRKISPTIAKKYLQYRQYEKEGKTFYGLFFPNNSDGFVFRNKALSKPIMLGKGDISTIEPTDSDEWGEWKCYSEWLLFEGFIDFLSLLTLTGKEPKANSLILNSTKRIKRAIEYLQTAELQPTKIYCFFDNDGGGRTALSTLKNELKDIEIIDKSVTYSEYNDLNDYLKDNS